MGRIYYIIGKSASGKDTVYRELLKKKPDLLTYVMYTTRPMRAHEKDGITYKFINLRELKEFEDKGKLIESRTYNTVNGPWTYATVDDGQIDLGSGDYLSVGTLESLDRLREYFGNGNIIPIYLEVEDGTRLLRAIRRESIQEKPDYRELCRRFLADSEDFSDERLERSGITRRFINNSIVECLEEIIGVIE